ncbi:uncharacterized protein PHALS_14871 [Plasmopara halstedii]|uniref:Uncharacterized protein n=1 Tax=Plasmopara halstedii TaxID=4781 RepID=A0A0P1A6Z9_PLAHL|nr:uncharacterized protein PHALS_14871 [Plasmopara halstedii]CEG36388.1 hypothetical protein PHALS_14871 [Plasmopara halstedii]|eukprot:XP_024572757.1 hypothetical protein PHALS_14871 [Plasmopara halstedii]
MSGGKLKNKGKTEKTRLLLKSQEITNLGDKYSLSNEHPCRPLLNQRILAAKIAVAARTRAATQIVNTIANVVAQPPRVTSLKFGLCQDIIVQQAAPPARAPTSGSSARSFRTRLRSVILTLLRN